MIVFMTAMRMRGHKTQSQECVIEARICCRKTPPTALTLNGPNLFIVHQADLQAPRQEGCVRALERVVGGKDVIDSRFILKCVKGNDPPPVDFLRI